MVDNPARQAQKIAVPNNAIVAFTVQYKDSQGKDGFSPKTEQFPFAQSATVDLTNLFGVKPGLRSGLGSPRSAARRKTDPRSSTRKTA